MNAAQRQLGARPMVHRLGSWLPLGAHVATGVLILFGLVVAVRRVAIGQTSPIALPTTLATAVVLLLLVLAIRRAAAGQLLIWLPTVVLSSWAVACSFPGTQVFAWLTWGAAIALDLAFARRRDVTHATPSTPHKSTADIANSAAYVSNSVETGSVETSGGSTTETEDGEIVLQHVVRVRDPKGNEYIHATLRGELAAGERRSTLYVGFCPPFPGVPQVEAEVIEGPPAVAKVVQALHNGVQVEVDLDEASLEPVIVTVEVAAYQMPCE